VEVVLVLVPVQEKVHQHPTLEDQPRPAQALHPTMEEEDIMVVARQLHIPLVSDHLSALHQSSSV
jgi:hypothetical protein